MQPSALYGKFPNRSTVWKEILPFGDLQTFATGVTTLLALTDYGSAWQALYIVVYNDDDAVSVDLVVDVSHGGVVINGELTQTKACPPNEERSVLLGTPNPDTYVRVQVNNAGAQIQGKWALLGIPR